MFYTFCILNNVTLISRPKLFCT